MLFLKYSNILLNVYTWSPPSAVLRLSVSMTCDLLLENRVCEVMGCMRLHVSEYVITLHRTVASNLLASVSPLRALRKQVAMLGNFMWKETVGGL